jgi:putative transposase
MYKWRKMSKEERAKILAERKGRKLPWHAPPHWEYEGEIRFIVTAACYEHKPVIGFSSERMAECETEILNACNELGATVYAWCVLPNHYHLLIQTDKIKQVRKRLGDFHGSSSFRWNGEENRRGRKVWYQCFERDMKSNRHFWASLNYVNNNAVHHGYVKRWQDWAFSSANSFLEKFGREKALKIWRDYPVLDYGKDWDIY